MREINSHKVNPANDVLAIVVTDKPGAGGANHRYEISGFDTSTNPSLEPANGVMRSREVLLFQNGPIAKIGVNGITQEVLIAICIDRLECFQTGPYACVENAGALEHLKLAQKCFLMRTKARMGRGVEGTHTF